MWTFVAGARLTSSELVATEVRRGLQRKMATKQLVDPLMSVVVAIRERVLADLRAAALLARERESDPEPPARKPEK